MDVHGHVRLWYSLYTCWPHNNLLIFTYICCYIYLYHSMYVATIMCSYIHVYVCMSFSANSWSVSSTYHMLRRLISKRTWKWNFAYKQCKCSNQRQQLLTYCIIRFHLHQCSTDAMVDRCYKDEFQECNNIFMLEAFVFVI